MARPFDRIWTRQPPAGAQPDRSVGLSALFLPGQTNVDLISGLALSSSVGTPTKSSGLQGPQLALDSSNESIYATALASHKTTAYSMVWVGQFLGAPTAAATLAGLTYNSSNTSPYVLCEIKRYNVGSNVTVTWNTSGSYTYLDSASLPASGHIVIVATVERYNALLLIKDLTTGAIYRAYTAATSADLASTSTTRIEIGDSLNARNSNSACAMYAIASKAWAEPFARRILENPWRLLQAPSRPLIFGIPSAAGSVSLTPDAAALAFSGPASAVAQSANVALTPSAAALAVSGPAPTVSSGAAVSLTPAVATVSIAGPAPTVAQSANVSLTPSAAAISVVGPAATVARSANVAVAPSQAALSISGPEPSVSIASASALQPVPAAITLQGYAPTVARTAHVSLTPGAAALVLGIHAPDLVHGTVVQSNGELSRTRAALAARYPTRPQPVTHRRIN